MVFHKFENMKLFSNILNLTTTIGSPDLEYNAEYLNLIVVGDS
jgi:hypothetical protein